MRDAFPHHGDLRIFEVDHPATQAWKRIVLEQGGIHVPDTVTFVPVDFEREELMDEAGCVRLRCGMRRRSVRGWAWCRI